MEQKQLLEEAVTKKIILSNNEVIKLKQKLQEYILQYYSQSPILAKENEKYMDFALDWAIKRAEQYLNPRISEYTGNLIIGDGSWLGNADTYFNVLSVGIKIPNTEKAVTINDFCNEYLERVGLIENKNLTHSK